MPAHRSRRGRSPLFDGAATEIGELPLNAPKIIELAGTAEVACSATATINATMVLAGTAPVSSDGSGVLSGATVLLDGSAPVASSGAGSLLTSTGLVGSGSSAASASATISVFHYKDLEGMAPVAVSASGILRVAVSKRLMVGIPIAG